MLSRWQLDIKIEIYNDPSVELKPEEYLEMLPPYDYTQCLVERK